MYKALFYTPGLSKSAVALANFCRLDDCISFTFDDETRSSQNGTRILATALLYIFIWVHDAILHDMLAFARSDGNVEEDLPGRRDS